MMTSGGQEQTVGFQAELLDSLRPHLDEGPHVTEMWDKVTRMTDADAQVLMGKIGATLIRNPGLRQIDHRTDN